MKKQFIPHTDAEKRLWLQNFQAKLAGYKTKYALTQTDPLKTAPKMGVFLEMHLFPPNFFTKMVAKWWGFN